MIAFSLICWQLLHFPVGCDNQTNDHVTTFGSITASLNFSPSTWLWHCNDEKHYQKIGFALKDDRNQQMPFSRWVLQVTSLGSVQIRKMILSPPPAIVEACFIAQWVVLSFKYGSSRCFNSFWVFLKNPAAEEAEEMRHCSAEISNEYYTHKAPSVGKKITSAPYLMVLHLTTVDRPQYTISTGSSFCTYWHALWQLCLMISLLSGLWRGQQILWSSVTASIWNIYPTMHGKEGVLKP